MTLKKRMKIQKFEIHKILLILVVIYFLIFGYFMAYTVGQPDQTPHNYYSSLFSETWGVPEDDMDVGNYLVTGRPYLYYWLNGAIAKVYKAIFPVNPPIRTPIIWRLFSVILSTFTVYYTYKLARKVTNNPFAGVLAAFFLANTLMFVFVSGGIGYDNLMNLAAVAAIYHLVSVYKGDNFVEQSLLTGIWVIIGSITKLQYLLLTLIIFSAWLFFAIKNIKIIKLTFSKKNIILGVVFIGFLGLFLGLYGVNFIRYSKITPSCTQIKPQESCRGFSNRLEYHEPFSLDVFWFQRDNTTNIFQYVFQYWLYKMVESTWGILSHKTFVPLFSIGLHSVLALWAVGSQIRYWKPEDKTGTLLIFIMAAYSSYILFMNYRNEVNFSFQHYAVSGRYFSPIYGVFITLMVHYFLKIRSVLIKKLAFSLAIMIYFNGGLWMYISRYAEVFIHWRLYK
ncbi:MAG TPA: hypothetical protein DDX29_00590 [Clostridiales bacterium]|nr:hypothetical protein [Clostridiales bacterium]